jgi:hypothetical protein
VILARPPQIGYSQPFFCNGLLARHDFVFGFCVNGVNVRKWEEQLSEGDLAERNLAIGPCESSGEVT